MQHVWETNSEEGWTIDLREMRGTTGPDTCGLRVAVDLDSETFTFSPSDCIMESIRNKLDPSVRVNVADMNHP
jgi:hypothetical protein